MPYVGVPSKGSQMQADRLRIEDVRWDRLMQKVWKHVDLNKRTAHPQEMKNGSARTVPLSSGAVEVLRGLPKSIDGRVFGATYKAIHHVFVNACRCAKIEDLRFHDLRHEVTSRLFEKGLNPMQLAAITGHKTLQMLKRYTHLKAEDLAELLK